MCVFINKIHSIKMLASKPLFIVSVMGSLYLWFLLRRKDKLFWIYDESSKNKIANEKTIERAESFRRVGITLMTIPVVLYAIKLIVAIGGYNGIEGDWLQFTMLWVIDYFFASMIWVPFVIAGLIFFVKSK